MVFHTPPPVGSSDSPYQRLFVGFSLLEAHREKQMELHHLLNVSFSRYRQIQGAQTVFLTRKENKQTLNTLMVFLIVCLFTQSDQKTFFIVILV